jgi:hypothetical protein
MKGAWGRIVGFVELRVARIAVSGSFRFFSDSSSLGRFKRAGHVGARPSLRVVQRPGTFCGSDVCAGSIEPIYMQGAIKQVISALASGVRLAIVVLAFTALNYTPVMGQPFKPVRKLTSWYTDRSLIDIEIVGSTSLLPDVHQLEPERVLRFRLERAYVHQLLTQDKPGFEIVGFGFDMPTGLADSLIAAVSQSGRFHEDIPGVPRVADADRVRRTLFIALASDNSAAALRRGSSAREKCRGAPLGNGLFAYEWQGRSGCNRPSYAKITRQLALYDDDLLLSIDCREESFRGLGCKLRFPFEGFGAQVTFHRDHLPRWREIVEFASAFLKSKQYK